MEQERSLLFGVFAVQLNMASSQAVAAAASAWTADPSVSLVDRLTSAQALSPAGRDLILRFVDEALAAHGGDGAKALAAFGGPALIRRIFHGCVMVAPDGQVSLARPDATTRDGGPLDAMAFERDAVRGVVEEPGRYTTIAEHARGGMGRVLLVHDDHLGREIALKELLPTLGVDEGERGGGEAESPVRFSAQVLSRFLQEARITGQLEHPGIVPVYELGHRMDGSVYYTMKLVRGKSLAQAIRECRSLEERLRLLPHFVDLCQAIAYAHSRHVIHRDIKPANVMAGAFGETVVLDWGLAKKIGRNDVHERGLLETLNAWNEGSEAAARTAYGQIVGTPVYMAPEQAKGLVAEIDERSDVYSLGVVLYEILTGKVPFEGASTHELLQNVVAGRYTPIEGYEKAVPPELIAIANKAMATSKGARYDKAGGLAEEIERFLAGAAVQAYSYSVGQVLRRYYNRHKLAVRTAAAAAAVLLAAGVYFNWRLYESRQLERAQRVEAEAANVRLQREAYASNILVAQKYLNENNVERALQYLDACPPEARHWEWRHLYRRCRPYIDEAKHDYAKTTSEHPVRAVLSLDGKRVLSQWNFGGGATVYNVETRTFEYESPAGEYAGWPFAGNFGPDPDHITLGRDYQTVDYINCRTGEVVKTFAADSGWLSSFQVSGDGRYAAGYRYVDETGERELLIWDFRGGALLERVPLNPGAPGRFAKIPEEQRHFQLPVAHPRGIVAGFVGGSHTLVFSDTDLCTYAVPDGPIVRHAPTEFGIIALHKRLPIAAGCTSGTSDFYVRHLETGRSVSIANDTRVKELALGGLDPPLAAAVLADRSSLGVWNAETGTPIAEYRLDTPHLQSADLASEEAFGVTIASRSDLRFWNLAEPEIERVIDVQGPDGAGHGVKEPWNRPYRRWARNAARTHLALIPDFETVLIYTLPGFERIHVWKPHDGRICDIAYSADGSLLATAGWDGYAKVWRTSDFSLVMEVRAPIDEACFAAAIAPDNGELTAAYGERSTRNAAQNPVIAYAIPSGAERRRIEAPGERTSDVVYSPDGAHLYLGRVGSAYTERPSYVRIDVQGEPKPEAVAFGLNWGDDVLFSPCGRWIVFQGELGEPVVVNRSTGETLYRIARADAFSIDISPDGERFVAADNMQKRLTVYRSEDGRALATFDGVYAPAFFSADGADLYSLTPDGRVRILHGGERTP